MRLCRFGEGRLGLVEGGFVRDVTAALDLLPPVRYPFPRHDAFDRQPRRRPRAREPAGAVGAGGGAGQRHAAEPDRQPRQDRRGAGELPEAPRRGARQPRAAQQHDRPHADHPQRRRVPEGHELPGGRGAGRGDPHAGPPHRPRDRAGVRHRPRRRRACRKNGRSSYVAGYAIGLDITIRGTEDRSFRKSPDSYSVLGPWLVTADEIPDPGALDLEIAVNGERRQQSNTRYLILGVAELVELASSFYTLHPGDVILTGTPEGVSPIEPGDQIVGHHPVGWDDAGGGARGRRCAGGGVGRNGVRHRGLRFHPWTPPRPRISSSPRSRPSGASSTTASAPWVPRRCGRC